MYSGAPPAPAPVTCDRGNKSDKLQQTQANTKNHAGSRSARVISC